MSDDLSRWRCDWCTYSHPVADFVTRHQQECVARPARGVA